MPIETDQSGKRIYEPDGDVLDRYIQDRAHVSVIRGPIGSGTSTASCMKIWALAMEQNAGPDGLRRSRWGVVRNTYPQLVGTTVKTWLDWFPEELYGRMNRSRPMSQVIRLGDIHLEVFFMALDVEQDVSDMRSLEVTGWWFNELEFIPKAIFDEAESRTGRYPAVKDGGCKWDGIIADMNAPSEDHWVPMMTEEAPYPDEVPEDERPLWPKDWGYFTQPPALIEEMSADGKEVVGYAINPQSENLKWLKPGFYEEKLRGKSKSWIDSRLMNRITFVADGDPVWPMFREDTHVAKKPLEPVKGHAVVVALDFGRRPCAIFMQEVNNRVLVQFELRAYGESAATFAPKVKGFLAKHYPGYHARFTGDPKGQDKGQADERTAYDVFRSFGMPIVPAPVKNNHLQTRLMAVEHLLNAMSMGLARLQVSPACYTLKLALAGRYRVKKQGLGEPEPIKDKWSDVADCLQYGALFLGEGRRMVGLDVMQSAKAVKVNLGGRSLRRVS